MLMLANFKDSYIRRRGVRVNLLRGDLGLSYRELASRWKWSLGKVQRFLEELKNDLQIDTRTDTEGVTVSNVISITNYDKYQLNDTENDTETGTETIRRRVQTKNVKNEKKEPPCVGDDKSPPTSPTPKAILGFDLTTGKFTNVNGQVSAWEEAFPAVNVIHEMRKAASWIKANPQNRKSNYERFLHNWLTKAQDKAPRGGAFSQQPASLTSTNLYEQFMAASETEIYQDRNRYPDSWLNDLSKKTEAPTEVKAKAEMMLLRRIL
jgi:hypothetical protein